MRALGEAARQAELSGYEIEISPLGQAGRYGWAVKAVIDAMPGGTEAEREDRVKRALWLFALTPEFNVLY